MQAQARAYSSAYWADAAKDKGAALMASKELQEHTQHNTYRVHLLNKNHW